MSIIRGAVGDGHPGLRTLRSILDRPFVRVDGDRLFVPDDLIAQWEIAQGELADIGLPPLCSFRLSLSADQPITSPQGNLKSTWLDAKHRPVPAVERDGTLISSGRDRYLLQDPLRSLVDAIEYMNAASDIDERLRRFSTVQARILETTQQVVAPNNLKSMVIYQATGRSRARPDDTSQAADQLSAKRLRLPMAGLRTAAGAQCIKRLTDLPMLWSEQWGRIGLQAPAQVRAELR